MPDVPGDGQACLGDDTILWRRIGRLHLTFDDNRQCFRIASSAFDEHPQDGTTSVVVAPSNRTTCERAAGVLRRHEGFGLAAVTVGRVRELGHAVVLTPTADEPAHASILGRRSKRTRRLLAESCTWAIPPPGFTPLCAPLQPAPRSS